jgi:hypothetical protein
VSDRADRVSAGQAVVDAIITDTERITRCAARLDLVALLIRVRIPLVVRSSSCVTRPAAAVKPQPEVRRRPEAAGGWCYGHVALDGDEVRPGDPSTNSSRRPQDGRSLGRYRLARSSGVSGRVRHWVVAAAQADACEDGPWRLTLGAWLRVGRAAAP